LFVGSWLYLKNNYLPKKIKQTLNQILKERLGLNSEIGNVNINILGSIDIDKIVLRDDNKSLIMKSDRLTIGFILPTLSKKTLILSSINLSHPYLYLHRNSDKKLNLEIKNMSENKNSSWTILVKSIHLDNMNLEFKDDILNFNDTFKDIDCDLQYKLPSTILFSLGSPDLKSVGKATFLPNQKTQGKIEITNINTPKFKPLLPEIEYLDLTNLSLEKSSASFSYSNHQLELTPDLNLENLKITKKDICLNVNTKILGKLNINTEKKQTDYQLDVQLTNSYIEGINYINRIDSLNGNLTVNKQNIYFDLAGLYQDLPIKAQGNASIESKPYKIQAKLNYVFDLNQLKNINTVKLPFEISGNCILNAEINGEFNEQIENLLYQAKLNIDNSQLFFSNYNIKLDNLSGELNIAPDNISWENTKFLFKEKYFSSQGNATNLTNPLITAKIISPELGLNLGINTNNQNLASDINLNGTIFDNPISFTAVLDKNASILSGKGKLLLKTDALTKLLANNETIGRLKPSGNLNINFDLNAYLKDLNKTKLFLELSSPSLSIYNLKLENLNGLASLDNQTFTISPIQANFYSGLVDLKLSLNYKKQAIINLLLQNVDIEKMQYDLSDVKKKEYAGNLNLQLMAKTDDISDKKSLKGNGALEIKNGKIWQLNMFKKLGEILFTPDFKDIVFTDGFSEFSIENQEIDFNYIELKSKVVNISGKGKINFDQSIYFILVPEVLQEVISESADLRSITSAIFGNGVLSTEITGTLKEPKIKTKSVINKPIKQIGNILKDLFN